MLTSSCCRGSLDSDARKTNISPPWDRADRNTVHSDRHHNATGRVGAGAGVAMLYVRGGRVGGVGLAIASLRDGGVRYAPNILGLRGNGVGEGVGI